MEKHGNFGKFLQCNTAELLNLWRFAVSNLKASVKIPQTYQVINFSRPCHV